MTLELSTPLKKVSLSVTEFALPSPRVGSIDAHSGLGRAQMTGIELHQKVQADRKANHPHYRSEVPLTHTFEFEGYAFEVGGRVDGWFEASDSSDETSVRIEEIKSSFNVYELSRRLKDAGPTHPYALQLRTYGYMHWLASGKEPALSLHLISSRNQDTTDLTIRLDRRDYEVWLKTRLSELVAEAKRAEKRARRRKKAARALAFPFEKPRSGQVELIATIEEGMRDESPMLIQAPTGLGKTVGVLYPSLRDALSRGQKVVYVTPKNSQHSVAEDAIARLQDSGAPIKGMTLTAKSKLCMKAEPLCNPEYCEYARDHYTKVTENELAAQLAKKRSLSAKTFKTMAETYQVCPFELQLEAAQEVDTVICDYNYVFAPRSALGRVGGLQLEQEGKPNLVIDEAHNLPARAMDMYSPSLSSAVLESFRDDLKKLPPRFKSDALFLLDECIAAVRGAAPADGKSSKIDPPAASFLQQDVRLREFLSAYLNSEIEIAPRDAVLRLCFYWSEFTDALEFVGSGREEFFTTFSPNPPTVRITCCDASAMLKECYDAYGQVVAFSATLKPFDYYSKLSGLKTSRLKTAEFQSPFPKHHRKLLIIPQISSKYAARERNTSRIAETIHRISALKRGNYFAFFPSFDFLSQVLAAFAPPLGFNVLRQERQMSRDDVDEILATLQREDEAHIVFAVQGGVFSEGIDYPGKMVIGAFVIGPPLPHFDLERETMRNYYQSHYSAGFDYAYTYPAMAKAVQAAGRVIRSETDTGIIVLMDDRFMQPSYAKSMPGDWFEHSPREAVSQSILKDVSQFWAQLGD